MATFAGTTNKSTNEITRYAVDFTNDLPSTVTVTAGTATHIPPSGSASALTISATSPFVYVTFGTVSTLGMHYIDVLATFSDSEVSSVRIPVNVVYDTPTARSGMYNLITEVRGMTEAGANDYQIAGTPYWNDAQIQDVLDIHRRDVISEMLQIYPTQTTGGSLLYQDYRSSYGYYEATTGGTAILYLQDSTGANVSGYTADYRRGQFQFSATQNGTIYYLTGRSYDLKAAAADIWRRKAAHYALTSFDFSTDNHSVSRSQVYTHCLEMANYFDGQSSDSIQTVQMFRSDI
jgi:hypothetical protein